MPVRSASLASARPLKIVIHRESRKEQGGHCTANDRRGLSCDKGSTKLRLPSTVSSPKMELAVRSLGGRPAHQKATYNKFRAEVYVTNERLKQAEKERFQKLKADVIAGIEIIEEIEWDSDDSSVMPSPRYRTNIERKNTTKPTIPSVPCRTPRLSNGRLGVALRHARIGAAGTVVTKNRQNSIASTTGTGRIEKQQSKFGGV